MKQLLVGKASVNLNLCPFSPLMGFLSSHCYEPHAAGAALSLRLESGLFILTRHAGWARSLVWVVVQGFGNAEL